MSESPWPTNLDEDQFAALRALTVFVRAGGRRRAAEMAWFEKLLAHEGLAEERRRVLRADLASPQRAWLVSGGGGRYGGSSRPSGLQSDLFAACLRRVTKPDLDLPKGFERDLAPF